MRRALGERLPDLWDLEQPGLQVLPRVWGQAGQSDLAASGLAAKASRPLVPDAHAPVAERRLVSILFADLVGFTTLAEGRDAEDTRELLSRYFDVATDVIVRYGGTVEKFIGDAVVAVWEPPPPTRTTPSGRSGRHSILSTR